MVKWSVTILGNVIEEELGKKAFQRIEKVRRRMASIRDAEPKSVSRELNKTYLELKKLKKTERMDFAKSYTFMLELMNVCENSYRTYRLKHRKKNKTVKGAEAIFYVLTAHPTEARAPQNISIFHEIQKELIQVYERGFEGADERLRALLEIAWKIEIVRLRKPRVQDEAEHIYSILLRDANLSVLLDIGRSNVPVYVRSWVGGDKDGHPGVDEVTLGDSLQLSREMLHDYAKRQLQELRKLTAPLGSVDFDSQCSQLLHDITSIKELLIGDAKKVKEIHRRMSKLCSYYLSKLAKSAPKPLARLEQLFKIFPGLVVPLELREDSAILMSDPSGDSLAIGRMLKRIGDYSKGEDPCWYARGMIISMAQSVEHIRVTAKMIRRQVGNSKIPVVPLFEQKEALDSGAAILTELLKDKKVKKIVKKLWGGKVEVMVGYSDSAKESGVIASRLAILDALVSIDKACKKANVIPVFFHGSGGSVDRGGGAIRDQMAGWPRSALRIYKATVQGEMVERTFASPEILESQLTQISENTNSKTREIFSRAKNPTLEKFAMKVRGFYQKKITAPDFLRMVELATPYSYLSALKIGSRPTKRTGTLSVAGLRAIPWVLCWTQTRVLFQTWWGTGSAWNEMDTRERGELKKAFQTHPVFRSYIHALGFTLAKIELPIWEFYLQRSALNEKEKVYFTQSFRKEILATRKFFEEVTGKKDLLWYRPWLGESIELRASMIHPLNLLEILAQKDNDLPLLRISVTGIASGMLTTG